MSASVDHLVVAARSLDEGVAWSEAIFGVTPAPGGKHPLMGTHNRLLPVGTSEYPGAYLEVIAVDPAAAEPGHPRWFGLDDERLQAAVAREPRLVHFVARCERADAAAAALRALGHDPGALLAAERATPDGILRWRLTIRSDGGRLCHGGVPALIEWSGVHPAERMSPCGIALTALVASGPEPARLRQAWDAIGLPGVSAIQGGPDLVATFASPRGTVMLHSNGL